MGRGAAPGCPYQLLPLGTLWAAVPDANLMCGYSGQMPGTDSGTLGTATVSTEQMQIYANRHADQGRL